MASVSPASSVSNVQGRESRLEVSGVPNGVLPCPVYPADLAAEFPPEAKSRMITAYVAAYESYCLSYATESVADSVVSRGSGARRRRRRRKSGAGSSVSSASLPVNSYWREGAVIDASYRSLMATDHALAGSARLGSAITVRELLEAPGYMFSVEKMRCAVLERVRKGEITVVRRVDGAPSVADVLGKAAIELRDYFNDARDDALVRQSWLRPTTLSKVDCPDLDDMLVGPYRGEFGDWVMRNRLVAQPRDYSEIEPGSCYLTVVLEAYRSSAVRELGSFPTCDALLRTPAAWYDLSGVLVKRMSAGVYHFCADGSVSVRECLAGAVKRAGLRYPDFSLGRELAGVVVPEAVVAAGPIGTDLIGGDVASATIALLREEVGADLVGSDDRLANGLRVAMQSQALLGAADKNYMRMLAAVGDSVITTTVAKLVLVRGGSPQEYQELRSRVTKNQHLAGVFLGSRYVSWFASVGEVTAKVGGEAFEALVGAVYTYCGEPTAEAFLRHHRFAD